MKGAKPQHDSYITTSIYNCQKTHKEHVAKRRDEWIIQVMDGERKEECLDLKALQPTVTVKDGTKGCWLSYMQQRSQY